MSEAKKSNLLGFYMCSLTFSFERMAYYAARWLLVSYVALEAAKGGLGLGKASGGLMQSYITGFTYLAPVLLSFIADRFIGARYLIPVGLVLMSGGYFIGGFGGSYASLWIMIVLVSIGTGFFKANLSSLSGTLFATPGEKEASFSTQYSFVNIGAFFGTFFIGLFAAKYGFLAGFKLVGAVALIGAIWFVFGWSVLKGAGTQPFKANSEEEKKEEKKETPDRPLAAYEKRRIVSIFIVSGFSVIFWIFWYLTYLAVYDYAPKYVQLDYSGFTVPTSWFDSLNSFMCIALGPILGLLWLRLSKRPQGDMSLYKKLAIGLFLLGASFLMLIAAEFQRGVGSSEDHKASIIWIVAFGVLLSLGEMFFSPLGNSFVAKYAPKRLLSFLMSVWVVATFFASLSYGFVYNLTLKFDFMVAYSTIVAILAVTGVVILVFEKKLAALVQLQPGEELLED